MKAFPGLFEQFKAYHSHGRPIVQYTGMVGIAAYPLFYLLRFTKVEPPYNDLWLRALAVLICVGLALRNYWPARLKPHYLAYSYGALLYCLPFFFIFTSLTNGGGVVAVANTLMAVFFMVLLSDWRNSIIMLLVGGGAAILLYIAVVPDPSLPMDYVARLPILVLVVIGGSLFKFAEKQAEAEKVKRTYAALAGSIAHEMRNPLSQIKHNLENMQQALPLPSASARAQSLDVGQVDALYRHLAQSEIAVKRGLQVIAMTLDEVSDKPMDTTAFSYLSAADATEKAVREYGYDNDRDRSRVHITVIEDFSFRGDETAYLFVLFNLLKNALYYLALYPDAQVSITVERHQVRVRDNGPGINPETLAGLFEPFRSAGKSGGTGLGLAYCKRVMHAFGGDIDCLSVPGEFTQFTMHFPVITQEENEAHRLAVLAKAQLAFGGKRILVVDDDFALRMTTRHKLQPLGAIIDEAPNGERALKLLGQQHYDMVVLDLNMPVLDGYAVAGRIRQGQVPANRDVCIVAYTSEPAHVASVKTQKAGMDGFVSKPCPQLPLIQALQHALEHPAARSRAEAAVLAGRRILLADDNPYNRKAVMAYLRQAGVKAVEVDHGQAVLEQLQTQEHWDAVLMDINMPGMDGLDAARAIRHSHLAWRDVPIIALTAHSDQHTRQVALAAGMNDFIVKPVDASALYETLRRCIAGQRTGTPVGPASPVPTEETGAYATDLSILDVGRLESYRRLGMLDELLSDYLPELRRLADRLDSCASRQDLPECLSTLHSLLGVSGEAGASALYQLVRSTYVPMREGQRWPDAPEWDEPIRALTGRTVQALHAYGAAQPRADAI